MKKAVVFSLTLSMFFAAHFFYQAFAEAAESASIPFTVEKIMNDYAGMAEKQGMLVPIKKDAHKYELYHKDCNLIFHVDSEGTTKSVLITGVPTHDYNYFPNTVEGLLLIYDVLTQKLSTSEKRKLSDELKIQKNPKTQKITSYGTAVAGGMKFDMSISTMSGLYLKVTPE